MEEIMILVSDFDLTIYPEKYTENIKAINNFVNNGNTFIIATGRPHFSVTPHIKNKIKYKYLIVNDGTKIYNDNDELIFEKLIKKETKETLLELIKRNYSKIIFDDENNTSKIFVRFHDEKDAKQFLFKVKEDYPDIDGYLSKKYMNFYPRGISKATAIKFLVEKENYSNIYVVGDGTNDISMFEEYRGISIKTSIEELIKLAKYHVKNFRDIFKNEEIK
jgi:HAD superfamily hydrolase (TIGR01484 family)